MLHPRRFPRAALVFSCLVGLALTAACGDDDGGGTGGGVGGGTGDGVGGGTGGGAGGGTGGGTGSDAGTEDDAGMTPCEPIDADGDGFVACTEDCCDSAADGCANPGFVNPGAYDVPGNGVDDDCSGAADDGSEPCDSGLFATSADEVDYARAIGLCRTTTDLPGGDRGWGVLSGEFTLADGNGSPEAAQRAIRTAFGANSPVQGQSFAVLATGPAASPADSGFVPFQPGTNFMTTSAAPTSFTAPNGDTIPGLGCAVDTTETFDPIVLSLTVRAPLNATGFQVRARFFSAEYPEVVCSDYDDFAVVLIDSQSDENPSDGNIARVGGPSGMPLAVNSAAGNSGFFTDCADGEYYCVPLGTYDACTGNAALMSTGFDAPATDCDVEGMAGAATDWVTLDGHVVGGETFHLRFAIWDGSDGGGDSLVLFDGFEWVTD